MPAKEVIPDEKQEKEPLSNVTVELNENNEPIKKEAPKEEPKYVTPELLAATLADAIKKATAPLYYEMRKAREPQQTPPPIQQTPKPEPTEWDQKLQKDWKGTVEELAEARLEAKLKEREEKARIESEKQRTMQLLEDNKRKVLERHQELNDETSQKANIYRDVLTKHPEYLANPFGPVLAMRDMEDELKSMGIIDEPTKSVVQKEVARQVRTNGAVIPKGTSTNTKSITLTKEQKEFCDANGIAYEAYVKNIKRQSNGGFEV